LKDGGLRRQGGRKRLRGLKKKTGRSCWGYLAGEKQEKAQKKMG